jgi:hypothetical protein
MIGRINWTIHAEQRLRDRGLSRDEVEQAIRDGHQSRQVNKGEADWRVYGIRADGRRFVVIYDHPVSSDRSSARIVTLWSLRD